MARGDDLDSTYQPVKSGIRGCSGRTHRHGVERFCAQKGIFAFRGKMYCWYHDPLNQHKFGQGYIYSKIRKAKGGTQ